ncbi:ABC transporter G family member 31-like [Tripterygium wilfordii]|uniref:ABC transporter G family member 31-like n=1 Tax=Tripterygium wilfordii TaxID=458696 RepID=A0A7J7CGL9_TRIWF|nr:ABC transporter G family member 31-like [Tripterygium wilfordii]
MFARISGYVEQDDIHSSQLTVKESLWFSSRLRLPKEVTKEQKHLLLMQLGGRVIYGGKLGLHSQIMIDYFQGINGISPIPNGYNPTTWMLEVTTLAIEERIGRNFQNYIRIQNNTGSFADSICSTANNCVWCHHLFYDPFSNDNKEIFYLVFLFLTFTYYTFSGMMAVGLIPNQDLASVVCSDFYSMWTLHYGFLVLKPNMLEWLTWCYYISPVTWTLRGIISSQLGDKESMIEEPQFNGIVKEYLKANLGYGPGMIGVSVVVLIGFYVLFFGVFILSIKLLNFLRR